jgi:hypothetical protein
VNDPSGAGRTFSGGELHRQEDPMNRKTALAAAPIVLTLAAGSSAMAVNLGILDSSSSDRVGELEITPTTPAAPTTTTPLATTAVDDNGGVRPDDFTDDQVTDDGTTPSVDDDHGDDGADDSSGRSYDDDSYEGHSGHDDDD